MNSLSIDSLLNNVIPDFERDCLSEYYPSKSEAKTLVFNTSNDRLRTNLLCLREGVERNELDPLLDLIRGEMAELEAMEEALKMKTYYEELRIKTMTKKNSDSEDLSKMKMGKSTLKSIFTTKKNEEVVAELEKAIETVKTRLPSLF